MIDRRAILRAALAMPAVVAVGNIMPISARHLLPQLPLFGEWQVSLIDGFGGPLTIEQAKRMYARLESFHTIGLLEQMDCFYLFHENVQAHRRG